MEAEAEAEVEVEAEAEANTTEMATTETTEMEPPDLSHWQKVVELVHVALWEGQLTDDSTCQAVVLIPKGEETNMVFAW